MFRLFVRALAFRGIPILGHSTQPPSSDGEVYRVPSRHIFRKASNAGVMKLFAATVSLLAAGKATATGIRGSTDAISSPDFDEAAAQIFFERAVNDSYEKATANAGKNLYELLFSNSGTDGSERKLISEECSAATKEIYDGIEEQVQTLFGNDGGCGPNVKMGFPISVEIDHAGCTENALGAYQGACAKAGGRNMLVDISASCDVKMGLFPIPANFQGKAIHVCVAKQSCSDTELLNVEKDAASRMFDLFKDDVQAGFGVSFDLDCEVTNVGAISAADTPQETANGAASNSTAKPVAGDSIGKGKNATEMDVSNVETNRDGEEDEEEYDVVEVIDDGANSTSTNSTST